MRKVLMSVAIFYLLFIWCGFSVAGEEADHICFRRVDADQDGKVTLKEFTVHYGTDKAKFKAADRNTDGHLTHDEYHDFLGHGAEGREANE